MMCKWKETTRTLKQYLLKDDNVYYRIILRHYQRSSQFHPCFRRMCSHLCKESFTVAGFLYNGLGTWIIPFHWKTNIDYQMRRATTWDLCGKNKGLKCSKYVFIFIKIIRVCFKKIIDTTNVDTEITKPTWANAKSQVGCLAYHMDRGHIREMA